MSSFPNVSFDPAALAPGRAGVASRPITMESLFAGAGESVLNAQTRIEAARMDQAAGPDGTRIGVLLSEVDLDVKFVAENSSDGLALRPVGSGDRIAENMVSNVRARLVVAPEEEDQPPQRSASDVKDEILKRPDVLRLKGIFGDVQVRPKYLGGMGKWNVEVREPGGNLLRDLQVADTRSSLDTA